MAADVRTIIVKHAELTHNVDRQRRNCVGNFARLKFHDQARNARILRLSGAGQQPQSVEFHRRQLRLKLEQAIPEHRVVYGALPVQRLFMHEIDQCLEPGFHCGRIAQHPALVF